ncbi:MAG: hypothetical protein ACKESB_02155 [Candidatus Hodgkinia cicadicola]
MHSFDLFVIVGFKRTGLIKLSIAAANAKPVPPISVVLGQKRINIQGVFL